MTEAERQNVALRREAQEFVDLLDEHPEHFWRCLSEAALAKVAGATTRHAKPSLVVDLVQLLKGFNEPGLRLAITFFGELDQVVATAGLHGEVAKHALQLSVMEQAADPDAHVSELLRRLARMVVRSAAEGDVVDG
jgi:hypothetical protein